MFSKSEALDSNGPWALYKPTTQAPWNLQRVVHLHRRAGFAATWKGLQRDLNDGPAPSIDRLLTGKARSEGVLEDFEKVAGILGDKALESRSPGQLKAWWLYRMQSSPDTLIERLTLVWHNHFATSNVKVSDLAAMKRQNDLFRRHGRGPFGELLQAVVHDPAMLVWLDAPSNRKGSRNENLGRELMELFTLGIGHYTEADVKEAARALTGWKVSQGAFRNLFPDHDDGEKIILGKSGRFTGDDLVRMLLDHPATARRLAWRLCEWLMGENSIGASAIDTLAKGLRQHNLDINWGIETILRSCAFFAAENIGNRVLGPVEYIINSAHALERFDPAPASAELGEWSARLGQDLFYPPNVAGWTGGRDWLTTETIIGRSNYAMSLLKGRLSPQLARMDCIAMARKHGRGKDPEDFLSFFSELLMGVPPSDARCERLIAALGSKVMQEQEIARVAVALILSSPEGQMG